jgi:hypothetical protein
MVDDKKIFSSLNWMAACLFISYLLPYHFLPFAAFYNEWLAIFAVVIVLAYFVISKKTVINIPWIAAIPIGIACVIFVQGISGILTIGEDVILPIAYFIVMAIAIILGANITAGEGGAFKLCMALASAHLFAGLVSVAIASLQYMGAEAALDPFVIQMPHAIGTAIRPIANISQPNQLALLFCMAIGATWWLYQVERLHRIIGVGAVIVLLWGLTLTQSRIGWIIMPVFILFTCACQKNNSIKKIPGWLLSVFAAAYIALIAILPAISSLINVATNSALARVGGSHSERIVLLQQALHISFSHPWFGAGWYEFGPQQIKIGLEYASSGYSQHAHNILINFAAEMGWPITIIVFGTLMFWLFMGCIRRPISKEVGLGIFFFLAILVHSLVEYPLWYAYVLVPISFLIGMVHQEQFGSDKIMVHRNFTSLLLGLMASGVIGVAMDYRRLESAMWMSQWASLGMETKIYSTDKPRYTIFPHFYDYFQAEKISIREGMPSDQIALMEQVSKRFGFVGQMERMALVYALNNRRDDAMKLLMAINKLHESYYPRIYSAWEKHAKKNPGKFAFILSHIPAPELRDNGA